MEGDPLLRQDARPRLEGGLVALLGQPEVLEAGGEVAVDLGHDAEAGVHLAGPREVGLDVEGLLEGARRPVVGVEVEEDDAASLS